MSSTTFEKLMQRIGLIRDLSRRPAEILLLAMIAMLSGCTPQLFRLQADRETFGILGEKSQDPRWQTPSPSVMPGPNSRNFDPHDPDRPPIPPDDPTAHQYMHCADGKFGYRGWHGDGDATSIESSQWTQFLDMSETGVVKLDTDRAVELAVQNSREYQFELEEMYLSALALTLERFEFDTQWAGFTAPFFRHFGTSSVPSGDVAEFDGNESNMLTLDSNLGFTRSFASGGQLLVDFANTFLWEFAGPNSNATFSALSFRFVQPLLRRFGREVRLEDLTQAERQVLYSIRSFGRFRKRFYFGLVSGDGGYLALLLQLQSVRNLEANLISLEQNLRTHEALVVGGIVSPLQVDQVFQDYQAGQLRLIQARNRLQTALDAFKIRLGLPPELKVELDDSQLAPFELNSPDLVELQSQVDERLASFRDLAAAPALAELSLGFTELKKMSARALIQLKSVSDELNRWKPDAQVDPELGEDQLQRERAMRAQVAKRLLELRVDLQETIDDIEKAAVDLPDEGAAKGWTRIQNLARLATSHIADLIVLQTQIRANLIELEPIDMEEGEAIKSALENRLDLMNQRATVVDAWRKIKVAADALESDLDIVAEGDVGTDPDGKNPVKFSSKASSYRVGVRLDGPLNRKAERNLYRARLVDYQRSRREFLGQRDAIVQAIRRDMRDLSTDRLNFEITRQSLLTAARQVELARVQLLAPGQVGDSSTTQDVLRAFDSLLSAKNALIEIWVTYETDRMKLMLDTEALQLDQDGLAVESANDATIQADPNERPAREIQKEPALRKVEEDEAPPAPPE